MSAATKPKQAGLEARLPADIHAMLKRAAEIQGRSLTDFVVTAAQDAARRVIEDSEVIRLSAEGQPALRRGIDQSPGTRSVLAARCRAISPFV